MREDEPNPELEKRWQSYLQRKRNSKYLIATGGVIIIISAVLGVLPVAFFAFTGTLYSPTPWSAFSIVGMFLGILLIALGIFARIPPNMGEGDALWVMKLGPFGKGR